MISKMKEVREQERGFGMSRSPQRPTQRGTQASVSRPSHPSQSVHNGYYPVSPRRQELIRRRKRKQWIQKVGLSVMGVSIAGGLIYYGLNPKVDHWFPTDPKEPLNYQQVALPSAKDETAFIQIVYKTEGFDVKAKKVDFATVSSSFKVTETIQPRVVSENEDYFLFELVIPHQKEDTTLMMSYPLDGETYRVAIGEIPKGESLLTQDASMGLKTPRSAGELKTEWLSQETSQLVVQSYQFFAESLLLTVPGLTDDVSYEWVENGEVKATGVYGSKANEGLSLRDIEPGHYFIRVDDQLLKAPQAISGTWYTLKRQGVVKEVTLSQESGFLMITVNELSEAPQEVYDLVIDPGHGGMDGGAVGNDKVEAEEALKISTYLAERFEDHGLKVKLTREDMQDPSQTESHDYDAMPYLENGRVDQVYRYQAKYVISNHLNAFDGSLSGYELYSSVRTTDQWTAAISKELKAIGREAKDSPKSEFWQSEGSYKKTYACNQPTGCDLIYIIRETGGEVTTPVDLKRWSQNYAFVPNYGAESILIEHAYIDHVNDMQLWDQSYEAWAEAIVKGTLTYLEIPYQEKE